MRGERREVRTVWKVEMEVEARARLGIWVMGAFEGGGPPWLEVEDEDILRVPRMWWGKCLGWGVLRWRCSEGRRSIICWLVVGFSKAGD